jgi:hypothetical protein
LLTATNLLNNNIWMKYWKQKENYKFSTFIVSTRALLNINHIELASERASEWVWRKNRTAFPLCHLYKFYLLLLLLHKEL